MNKVYYIAFLTAFCLLAVSTSCEHKHILCPVSEEIDIVFEWNDTSGDGIDGMTLLFYPQEKSGRIWRFDIAGSQGGSVSIPSGTYQMIACNNDLPGITLEDTGSPSAIRASARLELEKGSGVYAGTGMFYCARVSRLEVTPCGVRYVSSEGTVRECGHNIVRCHADSMATVFTVRLTDVSGIGRVRSTNVTLHGVSSSMLLESEETPDNPAALSMHMLVNTDDSMLSGQACAFARADLMDSDYRISLQIVLTDGTTVIRDIDIKPENLNIISRHNVLISVNGIVIPDDGSSGDIGGIGAIVDGWQVIDIDLRPTF